MESGRGGSSNRGASRRLSVTKKKTQRSNTSKERLSNGSKAGSITSFFSNTPPCKLACPLCRKLVPRYKINEHIDSQCQKFLEDGREDASQVSEDKQKKIIETPSNSENERKDTGEKTAETSSYFKKNCVPKQDSPKTNLQAKVVNTVGLRSLSSKLSRKAPRLPSASGVSADDKVNNGELSSSQKENTFESVSCVVDIGNSFPSEPAASNQLQVQGMEKSVAVLAETSSSSVACHLGKSPSKVLKRRSDESQKTDTVHKKSRYISKSPFPVFKGQETNLSSDQTEAPSRVCDVPSSATQTEKETTDPMDEPEMLNKVTATEGSENRSTRQPYYLQNFRTVLESVLENEDDRMLFNEDDFSAIHAFQKLSGNLNKSHLCASNVFIEICECFCCRAVHSPNVVHLPYITTYLNSHSTSFPSTWSDALCTSLPKETEMASGQ